MEIRKDSYTIYLTIVEGKNQVEKKNCKRSKCWKKKTFFNHNHKGQFVGHFQ